MANIVNIARGWLRRSLAWSNSRQSWHERIALASLVAGAAFLVGFHEWMPLLPELVAWTLLSFLAALLLRRGWLKLFGPILFYDLVSIARRRRYFWLRISYIGLLAVVLGWVYLVWMLERWQTGLQAREMTDFAEPFFYTFMIIQLIVVAVLTPAYTAGAIADEKDRKTLEFLLATDLRNREIVFSKLLSRLANLTLLVLAGLPILSFLQFLGGVDPNLVLAGFAATGLTMVSLASFSILNSAVAKRPRDAIALTYLGAVAYLVLSGLSWFLLEPSLGIAQFPSTSRWTSPVTLDDVVHWLNAGNLIAGIIELSAGFTASGGISAALPELLWKYAVFHGSVSHVCTAWSVVRIRAIAVRQAYGETKKPVRRRWLSRPPVGPYPMLWKEVFAEPGPRLHLIGKIFVLLLVAGSLAPLGLIFYFFFWSSYTRSWTEFPGAMNAWVRIVGTMVACLLLLAVAVRAASSFGAERDRQTLDALLASPLTSDGILFAKWLGSVVSIRWGWVWLGSIYVSGLVTHGLHQVGFVLLIVAWFVYAFAISGIGIWFSIACKTTLRATVWSLLATTVAGVGHWLLWMCCAPIVMFVLRFAMPGGEDWQFWSRVEEAVLKFQGGLTPPAAMGICFSLSAQDLDPTPMMWKPDYYELIGYGIAGLAFWCGAAIALWFLARWRFRKLSRRSPIRRPEYPSGPPELAGKTS
jgi:ABC-type transport system involved in multi-copper enzyme maturation permease subunit